MSGNSRKRLQYAKTWVMTATMLDGKSLAKKIRDGLRTKILTLKEQYNKIPGLAYVVTGNDPATIHYVSGKAKACQEIGMFSEVKIIPETAEEKDLLAEIDLLNARKDIHGIIVQLPLQKKFNTERVVEQIDPVKDVDSFHPLNRGKLFTSGHGLAPCTPKGVIRLLKESGIALTGKHVVILGRSIVVGRPLAMLMLNEDATVTVCHRKTRDFIAITQTADIVVAAVGQPQYLKKHHIKPGAVVVDVGIHEQGGRLSGDVDPEVAEKASALTPVPGGVGPMTVATLLENTVHAFEMTLKGEERG